jgi:hypothetical protein
LISNARLKEGVLSDLVIGVKLDVLGCLKGAAAAALPWQSRNLPGSRMSPQKKAERCPGGLLLLAINP